MSASSSSLSPARADGGFSLVELLISLSIAMILLGIVTIVFGQVQAGTGLSLQRAQLALSGQTLDARLRFDAKTMLGPSSMPGEVAGAIVIVPGTREGYIPLRNGQMSAHKVRLRCDQLAFVSDQQVPTWTNNQLPPNKRWLASTPTNLHDPAGQVSSYQALVWYGAIQDATVLPGAGDNQDPYFQAHHWRLGRQCKLLTGGAVDLAQLGVTPGVDSAPGTVQGLADAASTTIALPGGTTVRRGGWVNSNYVQYLAVDPAGAANVLAGAPASSKTNFTNLPKDTSQIAPNEYRHNPVGGAASGLQFSDIQQANLRLLDNCSEIIVQWAGDLDKNGEIDTYPGPSETYNAAWPRTRTNFPGSQAWNPAMAVTNTNFPGHPLAGSIIWYPEEIHNRSPWFNANVPARMDSATASTYNNGIKPDINQWYLNFPTNYSPLASPPTGFPGQGPSTLRFGGHANQTATWYQGFQLEYGEQDNATGQASAPDRNIPDPYVFRFDDDQWRKVRYGFRQDGSMWSNAHDGKIIPKFSTAPLPPAASMWSPPVPPADYADGAIVYRSTNGQLNKYQARAGGPLPRGDPYDNAGATTAEGKPWILLRDTASPSATGELGRHYFPYPPTPGINDNPNPDTLYASLAPSSLPTPLTIPTGVTNFANSMGNWPMPPTGQAGAGSISIPCRTAPRATSLTAVVTGVDWPNWTSPTAYVIGKYFHYPARTDPLYFSYSTPLAWNPACNNAPLPDTNRQYSKSGTVILYGGLVYTPNYDIPSNGPLSTAAPWAVGTAYPAQSFAIGADASVYFCAAAVAAGGLEPSTPNPEWVPVTPGASAALWNALGDPATLVPSNPAASVLWATVPYPVPNWPGALTNYSKGQCAWNNNLVYFCKKDVTAASAPAWNVANAVAVNGLVQNGGNAYTALQNIPGLAAAPAWSAAATYAPGSFAKVGAMVYYNPSNLAAGLPAPPTAPWMPVTPGTAVAAFPAWSNINYPIGTVVSSGGFLYANTAVVTAPAAAPPALPWALVSLWKPYNLSDTNYWIPTGFGALGATYPPPFGFCTEVTQTGDLGYSPSNTTGNNSYNYWRVAAKGDEPVYIKDPLTHDHDQNPYFLCDDTWGPGNARTITYNDNRLEYLTPVNDPYYQGTRADWRNPQSDWPRLIRLRVRLHDTQGKVVSYSDEFLVNGRDNDGDGKVNNPEEAIMSGIWYEYIFAVPYPRAAPGEERVHTR